MTHQVASRSNTRGQTIPGMMTRPCFALNTERAGAFLLMEHPMSADQDIAPEIGKALFLGCLAILFALAVVSAIAVAVYRAFH